MIRIILSAFLAFALAACQANAPTQTQLQTDAALVAPVLDIVIPALLAKPGISADDVAAINKDAADIKAAAQLIAGSFGSQAANATTLAAAVKALAPVAIKYLAADPYKAGLMQAAVDLTPLILQAAGVPVASQVTLRAAAPK